MENNLYDINLIANYIISKNESSIMHFKVQKLLYYIQAWSLSILDKPLFDADFEAWVHGPVCKKIYDRFGSLYSFISKEENTETKKIIHKRDIEFIDYVLNNYMSFSDIELEYLIKQETPWKKTREGFGLMDKCDKIIPKDLIKKFYTEKWKEIN